MKTTSDYSYAFIICVSVIFAPSLGYFSGVLLTQSFQIELLINEQIELKNKINEELVKQNKILDQMIEIIEENYK